MHGGAGLGKEVLDDHLLNVAVAPVGVSYGVKRPDARKSVLADAYQESRREGNREAPSSLEGLKTSLGFLVGTGPVACEVGVERFKQHALRGGNPPEGRQVPRSQRSGIRMWQ